MTVPEYLQLKRKKTNLSTTIKGLKNPSPEKMTQIKTNLQKTIDAIAVAEKSDEDIINYKQILKRKIRLQRQISSWKKYKKDTSKLKEQLSSLSQRILEMESAQIPIHTTENIIPKTLTEKTVIRIPQDPTPSFTTAQTRSHISVSLVNTKTPPTYYIINLAWTHITKEIQNPVKSFLNMSNYMSVSETPNTITWKYSYDTTEEKAQVKAMQTCSAHLLQVMKDILNDSSDAEIFGKIQKY